MKEDYTISPPATAVSDDAHDGVVAVSYAVVPYLL